MLGLSPWLSLAAVCAAAILARLLGRRGATADGSRLERAIGLALEHRWAPVAFGALTTAVVWIAWGGLDRSAVVHDEAAYLLQAQLFARGRWASPAPLIPEFFEQLYVLVTPVLASKYPPGHSLVLAPGALLGLPGLPVILLDGLTGALVFALGRRVAGSAAGLLTWLIWVTCFPAIYFRASYLSEVTSGAAWMLAWWCLLRWRETRARAFLAGVAAAVGVVGVTRPLTAAALAIPIAVVVARDMSRRHAGLGELFLAAAVGVACVALIPLWSARTTGSPLVTPLGLYTRLYVPFDGPGFGVDTSARAVRPVPPDMALTNESFREEHRAHTVAVLPRTLAVRARMIARDMWYDWRLGLAPFAAVGLIGLPAAAWFGLATLAVHLVLYLLYAHPAFWTVYYLESEPVLALLTAIGVVGAIQWAAKGRRWPRPGSAVTLRVSGASLAGVISLACIALMPGALTLRLLRRQVNADRAYFERFDELVRAIPEDRAVVFVRYSPTHNDNLSLVRNSVSYDDARVWIVHDRGADNARLLRAAPARSAYAFDEATWTLRPLYGSKLAARAAAR